MGFLGMNVSAATGAKLKVAETSGAIGTMTAEIVSLVNALRDDQQLGWTGADARRFFADFERFAPTSKSATDELGPQVRTLAQRIENQENVSRA